VKTDHALADTKSIDSSSGTTVLMALILGRWEKN
jgi:protein phosphatase 2C family protein 2/3